METKWVEQRQETAQRTARRRSRSRRSWIKGAKCLKWPPSQGQIMIYGKQFYIEIVFLYTISGSKHYVSWVDISGSYFFNDPSIILKLEDRSGYKI